MAALLSIFLLQSCASGYAPVSDRSIGKAPPPAIYNATPRHYDSQRFYRVQTGDTLYAIAFRYGLDFKGLARANDIGSDYRIFPGQLLKLQESSESPAPVRRGTVAKASSHKKSKPLRSAERPKQTSSKTLSWQWPVAGPVIQGFSANGVLNKGINIAANSGVPVHAAESGEVVYAGSGLLGYGNLIIIKHDAQFLSAYAHNSKILVKERDRVNQGEKIAEVGKSGTVRPMLHFEIRKDGKPVNPLHYLPQRK